MIGIITFHWATNYGAVLQAYALQTFLKEEGYETEIVNYVPWSTKIIQLMQVVKKGKYVDLKKEKELEIFRKKHMKRSIKFYTEKQLKKVAMRYTTIVCGSDQIWNESFTLHGEFRTTLAYFASFVCENTKRISYAASFGDKDASQKYLEIVKPEIKKFSAISVRENSGQEMVLKFGLSSEVVCDPTLLLTKNDYLRLIHGVDKKSSNVFAYILHDHIESKKIAEYVMKLKARETASDRIDDGLIGWLYQINTAEIVVTNSFHGVMLSIILNKPFIAILIDGSGMNDRIITILQYLGLENRMIFNFKPEKIDYIVNTKIEWESINLKLDYLRNNGKKFLIKNIS